MPDKLPERRSKGLQLTTLLGWSALLAWVLFLIALVLFHYARPELETGLIRYFQLPFRSDWVIELKNLFLYFLWACCGLTVLNVIVNLLLKRRRTDYVWFNSLLLLVICVVSLLFLYL
ncbi:hypothetical protein Q4519_12805 [Motilimonas sp. 1_MG-2023]|uniref:hypothetical protein n=1 Tax=Motilimonas sp. 1_MG-2023 TaxID=3062672 RepID=UPI0026E173E2|nr:hypothetical protein [Motilimonas sp. 1_MG-2023]MDO6526564.1 hypothetical protein [Motilimonas sp. 1_MG-2023]